MDDVRRVYSLFLDEKRSVQCKFVPRLPSFAGGLGTRIDKPCFHVDLKEFQEQYMYNTFTAEDGATPMVE